MPKLRISRSTYQQIKSTIGTAPAEQGGMLGGNRRNFVVRHFQLDDSADRSDITYSPDYRSLNQLLSRNWNPAGINLLGFVHSHPPSLRRPSQGDITYAQRILQDNPRLPYLLLPIVISAADQAKFELHPYAAIRRGKDVRIVRLALSVVRDKRGATLTRIWEIIWLLPAISWLIYRVICLIKQKQVIANKKPVGSHEKRI